MVDTPLNQSPAARSAPSVGAYNITAAMVSDAVDLTIQPKAIDVVNDSSSTVVVVFSPLGAGGTCAARVRAGEARRIDCAIGRIWNTGSTGLSAGLTAGTVEIVAYFG